MSTIDWHYMTDRLQRFELKIFVCVLLKKQSHLHLGCPWGKQINIKFSFWVNYPFNSCVWNNNVAKIPVEKVREKLLCFENSRATVTILKNVVKLGGIATFSCSRQHCYAQADCSKRNQGLEWLQMTWYTEHRLFKDMSVSITHIR